MTVSGFDVVLLVIHPSLSLLLYTITLSHPTAMSTAPSRAAPPPPPQEDPEDAGASASELTGSIDDTRNTPRPVNLVSPLLYGRPVLTLYRGETPGWCQTR